MSTSPRRPTFNFNLEALRGLAALTVVWHHVIYHGHRLDPAYVPTGVGGYNPPGHLAVLIFFLLSGYVIGHSHPEPLRASKIYTYLRKRFTRIYPMYVLAVLAGVAASGFTISGRAVAYHLLFWQGWGEPGMFENNPLWSLQYEVLYYLAFIPLSVLNIRPWLVTGVAAIIGAVALFIKPTEFSGALAQYIIGLAFWALGWALSVLPTRAIIAWPRVLSALLLLLCLEHLNPLTDLLGDLNAWLGEHRLVFYQSWDAPAYAFNSVWGLDYSFLPYAAIIVLSVGGIGGRVIQRLALILQLLPLYGVFQVSQHWQPEFTIPVLLYAASLLLYFTPGLAVAAASRAVVQRLVPLGAISYGIYIIHFPILFMFGKVELFAGSAITFMVRAMLYIPLVLIAATWMDKVFQPWVRKRLGPAPSVPPPALAVYQHNFEG